MIGVVTVVVKPLKSNGKVLVAPITCDERASSSYDKVKPNSAIPIILGKIIGNTTYLKVW